MLLVHIDGENVYPLMNPDGPSTPIAAVAEAGGLQPMRSRDRQADMDKAVRLDRMINLRQKLDDQASSMSTETAIDNFATLLLYQLITTARRLDDWPLLITCCERYQRYLCQIPRELQQRAESINNLRLLARAYQQMGLFTEAQNCLQGALLEHYQDQSLTQDYYQCLQVKRDLPVGQEKLRCDKLRLTPMRVCHENDFFWQYTSDIAELCKLPDFHDDDEESWCDWLRDYQQRPFSSLFAIIHCDWGYIGSAGIDIARGVGFVSYWLGPDFQGRGFAPEAVALLLDWAGCYLGLRCCYAVVYEDNTPSKKVLQKLSFRPVPLKVADDYGDEYEQEYVYYRGPCTNDRQLFYELNQFFIDTESDLRVLALPGSSGWQ